MTGLSARVQANAFESWRRLGPNLEVLILGDEPGLAETAKAFGFRHVPRIRCNAAGTPLISDAWRVAREYSTAKWLLYCNADILFHDDLIAAVHHINAWGRNRFLGIGQRIESSLEESILEWRPDRWDQWASEQRQKCPRASVVCKDFFLFPRHLYPSVPDFAVGRGNWDNWIVYEAHRTGTPVVDLTAGVTAIHQPHDHAHAQGRRQVYMDGSEARENQRLGRGRHLLIGSHISHYLDSDGKIKPAHLRWLLRAAGDTPRFLQLLRSLWKG